MNKTIRNALRTAYKVSKRIILHRSPYKKLERLFYFLKFISKKNNKASDKSVLFYISTIPPSAIKKVNQLFSQFQYCGYTCYYDISFSEYMKLNRFGIKAILLNDVYHYKKNMKNFSIVLSDNKEYLENQHKKALKIFLSFRIFKYINTISKNDFFYPLVQHFNFNCHAIEANVLKKQATSKRKIGVFFAGNINSKRYTNILTKELFGVNTRYEIFDHLINNLSKDVLYLPKNLNSFLRDIELGILENKVVIIDTNNFELPPKYYFDILLQSNFFLHMPGILYPYCHNQIESMMSGCIPVTQFSRFFVPSFQHELNSLLFDSMDDLIDTLLKINSGNYSDTVQIMCKNISEYYLNHHSFESFKKKLSYTIDNNLNYSNYFIVSSADNIIQELIPNFEENHEIKTTN